MKKRSTWMAVLGTIISLSTVNSCSVRRGQDITKHEFVPNNKHVLNGQKVFMANCNKCHPVVVKVDYDLP